MIVLPVEWRTPMPPSRFSTDPRDPDRNRESMPLAALPTAAGAARHFVVAHLRKWGLDPLCERCELVASELVTNAVTHASRPIPDGYVQLHDHTPPLIVLQLRLTWRRLFCEVWDPDPRSPIPLQPEALEENGRGLLLVTNLRRRLGLLPQPDRPRQVRGRLVGADPMTTVKPGGPGHPGQQGPPDGELAPVPDLVLRLPDRLAQDEMVRGLALAMVRYRERMAFKVRFFQRHVEGVDKAADPARYNRLLGQAMAYEETVAHLDESLVEVFELWQQYEHWDQIAQQRCRSDGDQDDQRGQDAQHKTPEQP